MKKEKPYAHLLLARDLLRELAAAFESGTYEGIHTYAETSDLFERLAPSSCPCCARWADPDPLYELFVDLTRIRAGVLEAEAVRDAASALAAAEVERARGVAQANAIIGDSLKGNEAYLRYLFIEAFRTTPNQTIYIPTEAGLPILEATRQHGATP